MSQPDVASSPATATDPLELIVELALAIKAVEAAARAYALHSHGNLGRHDQYRRREEARDLLLDALAHLDRIRGLS